MMAVRRLAVSSRPCSSCSVSLFNSFASACGSPLRLARPPHLRLAATTTTLNKSQICFNSSSSNTVVPGRDQDPSTKEAIVEPNPSNLSETPDTTDTTDTTDYVPWFLRVETPKPPTHPLAARQALPDLPEDPPPVLAELLRELSDEHGISDLTLLDLRSLDPAPAIGADTIMIIGSARSERHLHTTADRTCRWLRSKHRFTPYADGLMGRNELKLKNRRKRRRGKLVSSQTGEVDDDSRVGWVCVNVGKQGLIVQLFTPGKREEIDLEGLWRQTLERDQRRKTREAARMEKLQAEQNPVGQNTIKKVETTHTAKPMPFPSVNGVMTQTRSFHVISHLHETFLPEVRAESSTIDKADSASREVLRSSIAQAYSPSTNPGMLGAEPDDTESTDFLKNFHASLHSLSEPLQIKYQIELLGARNFHSPNKFPSSMFLPFLRKFRATGKKILPEHYYILARHVAMGDSLEFDDRHATIASIIQDCHAHTESEELQQRIRNCPEFRYIHFLAAAPRGASLLRENILASRPLGDQAKRFGEHTLHDRAEKYSRFPPKLPFYAYTLREHHLDYLTALAMTRNWHLLWVHWKKLGTFRYHRDADFFKLALGLLVLHNDQKEALKGLRLFLSPTAMAIEQPPVGARRLTRDLMRAIKVAERGTESGEFAKIKELAKQVTKKLALANSQKSSVDVDVENVENVEVGGT